MKGFVIILIYCCGCVYVGNGCIATTPGADPVVTTTVAPVTTTTVVTTTTTTAATTCTDCTLGQITFTPAAGPGTETPVPEGPTCAADGSLTLVAICPATNTGPIFMQFNTGEGGPSDPAGGEVRATLNCVDGNWVFAPAGQPSRVITEVNCVAA